MLQKEKFLAATTWKLLDIAAKRGGRSSQSLSTVSKLTGSPRARSLPSQALRCCGMADRRGASGTPVRNGERFRLTMDTINPYVKNMEYAVRGKMPQEAAKIEAAIEKVRRRA